MEEYPKQVTLRDGVSVTLRPLRRDDEPKLIEFFQALPRGSTQFLKHDVRDPVVVRRFFETMAPENNWAIIAEATDGTIVGDATLHAHQRGWRRHVGELRGVVAQPFRRRRLATALVHEIVEQASVRGLRKLKVEILDSQEDARRVFERMGFHVEARLSKHALDLDGNAHDIVILTSSVDEIWQRMEELIGDMELAGGKVF